MRFIGDVLERTQDRRRQRVEAGRHPRIAAVDRIKELHQVIRANGQKIDPLQQFVELIKQRRYFNHAADLDLVGQFMAVAPKVCQLALD